MLKCPKYDWKEIFTATIIVTGADFNIFSSESSVETSRTGQSISTEQCIPTSPMCAQHQVSVIEREARGRITCNFNAESDTTTTAAAFYRLPVCHTELFDGNASKWINSPFYKYQFERTTDGEWEGEDYLNKNSP